jgi:hypothetical protein
MLYFDVCTTSVYFFDVEFEGFGAVFYVKKEVQNSREGIASGLWDSTH